MEKTVKMLNTINLQKIRKKIGQIFCLRKAFCNAKPGPQRKFPGVDQLFLL